MTEQPLAAPGKYRWAVKTVSDEAATALRGQSSTSAVVGDLIRLPAPAVTIDLPRQPGPESTIYAIEAVLVAYKAETDQDYHLVVQDDAGHSMIVEIPDPSILASTCQFAAEIASARQAFDAKFGKQMAALKAALPVLGQPVMITKVNQPVKITGVGYFDEIHGQTGVAPNGFELHPVLMIEFS